jgi:predicted alpha/beta hydrolase
MSDWAALDVAAAVAWMRERYKTLPLNYIGHSFGGQALGLLANNTEVSRALLIAAQAGYWKLMASPERFRVYALLNFVGLPLTRVLGYAPGWSRTRRGPAEGRVRAMGRLGDVRTLFFSDQPSRLDEFPKTIAARCALCLSDDPWATPPAVGCCVRDIRDKPGNLTIAPANVGAARIGHFGSSARASRHVVRRGGMDRAAD